MTRTTIATLLGVGLCVLVAWRLGGSAGNGALAGGLAAATVTGLGLVWQRHVLARSERQVMAAMVVGFLLKLFVLAAGGIALRFVETLRARADWQAFVLSFVAVAVVVLIPGTLDNARALRAASASRARTGQPVGQPVSQPVSQKGAL